MTAKDFRKKDGRIIISITLFSLLLTFLFNLPYLVVIGFMIALLISIIYQVRNLHKLIIESDMDKFVKSTTIFILIPFKIGMIIFIINVLI